jgi:hypothetical protein
LLSCAPKNFRKKIRSTRVKKTAEKIQPALAGTIQWKKNHPMRKGPPVEDKLVADDLEQILLIQPNPPAQQLENAHH